MRKRPLLGRLSFAAATRWTPRPLHGKPPRGCLSISFDDVPRTAWTEGGAILARHGLRGTYYLSGDLCEGVFEGRPQYRREDVPAIAAAGHEVGSHLFHHLSTLTLSARRMRDEITANDAFLAGLLGPDFRPRSFAYPYGEVSLTAKRLCRDRFDAARSVQGGLNGTGADRDQLRILAIDNLFADQTDWNTIFRSVAEQGVWAILLAHGIDDSDHPFSCPPARLDSAIRHAIDAGLDILPVAEALDSLT